MSKIIMLPLINIKLFEFLEKEYPNWIIKFQDYHGNPKNLLTSDSQDLLKNTQIFIQAMTKFFNKAGQESILIINMKEFDLLSPSAANMISSGCLKISKNHKTFIVFTQVFPEVLEGLKTTRSMLETEDKIFWAIDHNHHHHLLKPVRESLQNILDVLEVTKKITASEIALLDEESPSKKTINRFSVYLQELFHMGLLTRQKLDGLERNEVGRGWTYVYRPAYVEVLEFLQ